MLTQERLKKLLNYDPETGVFKWNASRGRALKSSVAGNQENTGYLSIRIDEVRYRAHRLAWFYIHAKFPKREIDHIDGVKNNNRLSNLREATKSENQRNKKLPCHNTSGLKGVCWSKMANKWRAFIKVEGKGKHLGYFVTKEEAEMVSHDARKNFHKDFANHG